MAEDCCLCSFTWLCVNVRVCNLHNPHRTRHIKNYKQHTANLKLVALLSSNLVHYFSILNRLTNTGWMVVCTFRLRSSSCFLTTSAEIWSLNGKTTRIEAFRSAWEIQKQIWLLRVRKALYKSFQAKQISLLSVRKAVYNSFKAKSQRAIRFHSCKGIFIIFAPVLCQFFAPKLLQML